MRSSPRQFRSRGFTLVEMLVVISIIGILAAILIPTVMAAMPAKISAAILELKDIEKALEAYQSDQKDYPPDGTSLPALKAHLRKAFQRIPNHNAYADNWWAAPNPYDTVTAPLGDPNYNLDPAESYIFFLTQLRSDVRDPFGVNGATTQSKPYYTFEPTKLRDEDGDGFNEYYPTIGDDAPLVYFDGRILTNTSMYNHATVPTTTPPDLFDVAFPKDPADSRVSTLGRVRPYQATGGAAWMSAEKFQLLCAGFDSHFGVDYVVGAAVIPKQYPDPNYYGTTGTSRENDLDNIANFSSAAGTLEDAIP